MRYCQDGILVYSETPEYHYNIYGHYEIQPIDVNDRPYFKMGAYVGIWWSNGYWFIGPNDFIGQTVGLNMARIKMEYR